MRDQMLVQIARRLRIPEYDPDDTWRVDGPFGKHTGIYRRIVNEIDSLNRFVQDLQRENAALLQNSKEVE